MASQGGPDGCIRAPAARHAREAHAGVTGPHDAPVSTPYALATYSAKNQERILTQCPHASEVRGFHAWLKAGRVVMKGQKGVRIFAPDAVDDGKISTVKNVYVFDVTQTQELPARAERAA
jgi:hypothetical protein